MSDLVVETSKHLFVDCEYATKVRDAVAQWIQITLPARDLKATLVLIKSKH